MKKYLLLGLALFILMGCTDPMGMTTRQTSRSSSKVEEARLLANAQIETARLETEATKYVATQETIKTGVIMAVTPWLLLIIGATIICALVVNWQGRIWYERTKYLTDSPRPTLPISDLAKLANSRGWEIVTRKNEIVLLDQTGKIVGRNKNHA
jgi:hypothetical protein